TTATTSGKLRICPTVCICETSMQTAVSVGNTIIVRPRQPTHLEPMASLDRPFPVVRLAYNARMACPIGRENAQIEPGDGEQSAISSRNGTDDHDAGDGGQTEWRTDNALQVLDASRAAEWYK